MKAFSCKTGNSWLDKQLNFTKLLRKNTAVFWFPESRSHGAESTSPVLVLLLSDSFWLPTSLNASSQVISSDALLL